MFSLLRIYRYCVGTVLWCLPHHALSRAVFFLARTGWSVCVIRWFIRRYRIDMDQFQEPDPKAYNSLNAFFTRALDWKARPIDPAPNSLLCPVDGVVSETGLIRRDGAGDTIQLLQAKGQHYSLSGLLANAVDTSAFVGGHFCTIYLSPRDYHRVHMPVDGQLRTMVYVPGRLFPVAPYAIHSVPQLFARNERIISLFDTPFGSLAVIMVGAMLVGSMQVVWSDMLSPASTRAIARTDYADDAIHLKRAQEMGRFNLGSTVILLLPPKLVLAQPWPSDRIVRVGQRIGSYAPV